MALWVVLVYACLLFVARFRDRLPIGETDVCRDNVAKNSYLWLCHILRPRDRCQLLLRCTVAVRRGL